MSYGDNLSQILKTQNILKNEASTKIGISVNTLSNILNGKVIPSESTKNKILDFIRLLGYSEKDLELDNINLPNLRIRSNSELSGIEKSMLREDLIKNILVIKKAVNDVEFWEDFFNMWDYPDENGFDNTFSERRNYLNTKVEQKNEDYVQIVCNAYNVFNGGRLFIGCSSPVVITSFLEQLGIRVFKVNLRTEKISGFCTSILNIPLETDVKEPVIVINEKVCNTVEKYLNEMAKQMYFMIAHAGEFDFTSTNEIKIETPEKIKEALDFAENIMIPVNSVNAFLAQNQRYMQSYSPKLTKQDREFFFRTYEFEYVVNRIKRIFYVGYKTAIKQLLASKWEYAFMFDSYEEAEEFYFECLKRHDKVFAEKITYRNGEPEPLPWDYTGFDAGKRFS